MKKTVFIFIILSLFIGCGAQASPLWCGQQNAYFNNTAVVDVTGYETLMNFPSGAAEIIENATVINTGGPKLIDTYIMPEGSLADAYTLESGLRRYQIYTYVSSATGVTQLNFTAFRKFSNGTEENFYTALSGDINDLTIAKYDFNYVSQYPLTLIHSDRLGIRVSANTTHSSPITVYWAYQGSLHTSMFETGYFDCFTYNNPINPTNGNESFAYSPSNATPTSVWFIFVFGALLFFAGGFLFKLRYADGRLSSERIIFSLLSTVVCFTAAVASLEIITPSGVATNIVYQQPAITILFALLTIISFANFVYSAMKSDVVVPENDYTVDIDAKVKAENPRRGKKE